MNRDTVTRVLRHKYGITIRELAEAAGISVQHLNDLELAKYVDVYDYRQSGGPLMQKAFEGVAANRMEQARRLSEDIHKYSNRLLDFWEEDDEL